MEEVFFPCSLSRPIWVITVVCAVIALVPGPLILFAGLLAAGRAGGWHVIAIVGFVVTAGGLPLLLCIAYAPAGYVVHAGGIAVKRRKKPPILLPADEILGVEGITREDLRGSVRTFGVGGFMGSFGYFWCPKLRSYRAYITRGDALVLIRSRAAGRGPRKESYFVISPDDREGFLATAQRVLPLPAPKPI